MTHSCLLPSSEPLVGVTVYGKTLPARAVVIAMGPWSGNVLHCFRVSIMEGLENSYLLQCGTYFCTACRRPSGWQYAACKGGGDSNGALERQCSGLVPGAAAHRWPEGAQHPCAPGSAGRPRLPLCPVRHRFGWAHSVNDSFLQLPRLIMCLVIIVRVGAQHYIMTSTETHVFNHPFGVPCMACAATDRSKSHSAAETKIVLMIKKVLSNLLHVSHAADDCAVWKSGQQ